MTHINSPQDAEVILQKLPCDMGIHRNPRKGTLNAPEEILENFETGKKILIEEVFPNEFSLEETHKRIGKNTRELLDYGKPVVSLGGDHSVSFPVIKELKENHPDMELVWLDSHLDLKKKVDNHISHDVVVQELLGSGFSEDEITFVGITRIDDDEKKFLDKHDLKVYRAEELPQFLEEYCSSGPTYLSVDIDVLREEEAPGTGYPDGQLSLQQVKKVIEKVSPTYADLVEVAPPFDKNDRTVDSAREILGKILKSIG